MNMEYVRWIFFKPYLSLFLSKDFCLNLKIEILKNFLHQPGFLIKCIVKHTCMLNSAILSV